MLATLALLKGLTMSGVLHDVPLEQMLERSNGVFLVRPTSREGYRKVEGMAEPCSVPWKEYRVEEVLRGEGSVAKGSLIQVEPADARRNCIMAKAMNSPVHPILIFDRYKPLDPEGLTDPARERVVFVREAKGKEMIESVGQGCDGLGALETIRKAIKDAGTKSVTPLEGH